mmetsp:Transcript_43500/g.100666  ORF Transcript_43500/g.100666 Transcript_43500/m.100666 type:complete len:164 (+) Transcript_43500:159-650(+)
MANVTSGELHIHPQYYYMGHFSKYIPPGSRLLNASVFLERTASGISGRPYGTCGGLDGLESASFLRPDGQVATVVLNCGDEPLLYRLRSHGLALLLEIPAHAIQTVLHAADVGAGFHPHAEAEAGKAAAEPPAHNSTHAPLAEAPNDTHTHEPEAAAKASASE